jgi:hypothetical protein
VLEAEYMSKKWALRSSLVKAQHLSRTDTDGPYRASVLQARSRGRRPRTPSSASTLARPPMALMSMSDFSRHAGRSSAALWWRRSSRGRVLGPRAGSRRLLSSDRTHPTPGAGSGVTPGTGSGAGFDHGGVWHQRDRGGRRHASAVELGPAGGSPVLPRFTHHFLKVFGRGFRANRACQSTNGDKSIRRDLVNGV